MKNESGAADTTPLAPDPKNEDANSSESRRQSKKGIRSSGVISTWIAVIGLASAFLIINLPFQYRALTATEIECNETPYDFGVGTKQDFDIVDPIEAGWPLRFYIQHSFADSDHHVMFAPTSLALNVLIAALFMAITYGYLRRKQKTGTQLSLADLLITVTVFGTLAGYWPLLKRQGKADLEIAQEIMSVGTVVRQSYWPSAIERWLPTSLRRAGHRITAVVVQNPSDRHLELIGSLPHLRSLRLGGGNYDQQALRRLASMRYLQDLRIAGTQLDPETVAALSDCPVVRQLNVTHTNCARDALGYFGRMPHLVRLMAMETLIPNTAWQESDLREKLEVLAISRPTSDEPGELHLQSWPKLRRLSLDSLDNPLNLMVFRISLRDMPMLETLEIDAFQLVDLDLAMLPRLTSLSRSENYAVYRTAVGEERAAHSRVRRLRLSDLRELDLLELDVRSIEAIEVEDCPSLLSVMVSSELKSGIGDVRFDLGLDQNRVQRLIECLGRSKAPKSVSVRGVDLSHVNLSPITSNPRIHTLDLSSCRIPKPFTDSLDASSIRTIDLRNTNADSATISRLIQKLPSLETLIIDSSIQRIRIENSRGLKTLRFDQHFQSRITSLHLKNSAELSSPFVVAPTVEEVHVENSPKLSGLAMPRGVRSFSLSGVQGLKWFFGGGPTCTDEIVSELMNARGMTHLTIAYAPASAQSYSRLFHLPGLVEVEIPGAKLVDDMVRNWDIPIALDVLDVRDCGLTSDSTTRLISRGGWKRLRLSGNRLDPSALPRLDASPDLVELGLGDVSITRETAKTFGPFQSLTELDLAGATIESGALTAILDRAPNLQVVNLTGSTADWNEILPAVQVNRDLKFRLSPVDATVALITRLTNEKKLIMDQTRLETLLQPQGGVFKGWGQNGLPMFESKPGEEEPHEFTRPTWSPDLFRPDDDSQPGFDSSSGIVPTGSTL